MLSEEDLSKENIIVDTNAILFSKEIDSNYPMLIDIQTTNVRFKTFQP